MADIQNEAIVVGSQAKALDQHISICYHVHMVPREKKKIQAISYPEEQRALKMIRTAQQHHMKKKNKKFSFRALSGWSIPDKTRKPDSKTQ